MIRNLSELNGLSSDPLLRLAFLKKQEADRGRRRGDSASETAPSSSGITRSGGNLAASYDTFLLVGPVKVYTD